jgi:hypothetical protein
VLSFEGSNGEGREKMNKNQTMPCCTGGREMEKRRHAKVVRELKWKKENETADEKWKRHELNC